MNAKRLKILGLGTGLTLGLAIYYKLRLKKKDRRAAELLRAIQHRIKPASVGILSENAFDIYYQDEVRKKIKSKLIVLKAEAAKIYAEQIHSAWAWWGDDENKVYGVFRLLKDKVQVSQVAKAYQDKYSINLIDKMGDNLTKTEIGKVLQIVAALPNYRTLK